MSTIPRIIIININIIRQGARLSTADELCAIRQGGARHVPAPAVVRTLHARIAARVAEECRAHSSIAAVVIAIVG